MICTKRPGSTSTPKLPVEISWFWQYTHFSGQPEKNTVPDPRSPDIGGSSHMCSASAMRRNRPRRRPPRIPPRDRLRTYAGTGRTHREFRQKDCYSCFYLRENHTVRPNWTRARTSLIFLHHFS